MNRIDSNNRIECFLRGWMDGWLREKRETQTTGKKEGGGTKANETKQNNTREKGKP